MNKKKIAIISVAGILVIFGTVAFGALKDLSYMKEIELSGINLTSVNDGSYTGTFRRGRFTNTLTVEIEAHKIMSITINEDVLIAKSDISDEVFRMVVEEQDTDIDAVAGATATSNAYLKSIENALNAH